MSHVLADNVASESRGGRRKFGEMEGITFLKEIVANDAHVCRHGKVAEKFEDVARALNEGNALPWNTNGKHCNDMYKLLLANFRRADRARALASGTEEKFGERDQLLADIHSAVNDNEERGRAGGEISAKRDERLAKAGQEVRANVYRRGWRCRKGREGSPGIYASLCERRPHPMRCALLFFGTAKQISILKNAASGVAGGLRPLAVGTILRRLASFLVLHKALPFAADYLLPHQVSTLPRQGRTFLCMDSARSWSSLGMIRTRLR
jgi:hypothetical protein